MSEQSSGRAGRELLIFASIVITATLVLAAVSIATYSATEHPSSSSGNTGTLGAGNANGSESSSTSFSTTIQSLYSKCDENFTGGLILSNGSQGTLGFAVRPGTSVALCITYRIRGGNLTAGDLLMASILKVNATPLYNSAHNISGWSYSYSRPKGISITPNLSIIDSHNLPESANVTVVYTISVSNDAVGYYDLGFIGHCPTHTPFAVTDNPASLSGSDFPGFFQPGSCMTQAPILGAKITGISGVAMVWLKP